MCGDLPHQKKKQTKKEEKTGRETETRPGRGLDVPGHSCAEAETAGETGGGDSKAGEVGEERSPARA